MGEEKRGKENSRRNGFRREFSVYAKWLVNGFTSRVRVRVVVSCGFVMPAFVREPADSFILRKEVIQPQVPLRLPCYDFAPVTELTLDGCPLAVGTATSDAPPFRGLTGGVYKAQEHIHRSVADLRLLAIPTSRGRVAALDLNWATFFGICSRLRVGVPLFVAL